MANVKDGVYICEYTWSMPRATSKKMTSFSWFRFIVNSHDAAAENQLDNERIIKWEKAARD